MTLTDEQRALVERIKAAEPEVRRARHTAQSANAIGPKAARLANIEGLTYAEAAARFGITPNTVRVAFRKLYPFNRRRNERASQPPGDDSRSVQAARIAYAEGITIAAAAARVGIRKQGVHIEFRKLYPDAPRHRGGRPPGVDELSQSARAARAAEAEGLTFAIAAERYGVSQQRVSQAHRRLFPDKRRRRGPRRVS